MAAVKSLGSFTCLLSFVVVWFSLQDCSLYANEATLTPASSFSRFVLLLSRMALGGTLKLFLQAAELRAPLDCETRCETLKAALIRLVFFEEP